MYYVPHLLLLVLVAAGARLHPLGHDAVEDEAPDGLRVRLGLGDGAGAEEHGGRHEVAQPPRVHLPKHVLEVGDVRGEGLVVVVVSGAVTKVTVEDVARGLEMNRVECGGLTQRELPYLMTASEGVTEKRT